MIIIDKYSTLLAFLKRRSQGLQSKKTYLFTPNNIQMLSDNAPDDKYLSSNVSDRHIYIEDKR